MTLGRRLALGRGLLLDRVAEVDEGDEALVGAEPERRAAGLGARDPGVRQ